MTGPPGEQTLEADRQWTFEAVGDVSRTFALSIDLLEEPVASWVCTGYLLCRAADTIEDDSALPLETRAELLDTYDEVLDPDAETTVESFLATAAEQRPADGGDDWTVLLRTDRVIRVFESFDPAVRAAMRDLVREMVSGMSMFLRRHAENDGLRIDTVDELEEYCWYVAGTVGELFTGLLWCLDGYHDVDTDAEDAKAFALLLQLVNIAKDVRDDYETEDNVYLPGEWLAAEGIDHGAVGSDGVTEELTRVVDRVVDHAESYAPGARRYLEALPAGESNVLAAAALPYLLALGTLRELQEHTEAAVTETNAVKLSRREVEALYDRVETGLTHAELDRIAATVREHPYHESTPME
jgi:farnesyl-diphosphate farnesyltransferase